MCLCVSVRDIRCLAKGALNLLKKKESTGDSLYLWVVDCLKYELSCPLVSLSQSV